MPLNWNFPTKNGRKTGRQVSVAPLPVPSVRGLLATKVLEILDVTPAFPDMVYHAAFHKRPDMPLPALIARMAAEVAASYAEEI